MTPRAHDVVLFGATGYVGRLTAASLALAAPDGTRIALGGRSRSRLDAVRDELGVDWPLVVADSADRAAMRELAESTTVVATTVGPYARYGLPLVEACATAGTHYADLAGEVLFVAESADRFHGPAQASGARIVHSCGYDSVPSDLGVLLTAEAARAGGDGELTDTTLALGEVQGGFSGGTVDSFRAQVDAVSADPVARRRATDPYALSPDRDAEPDLGDQGDAVGVRREEGRWTGPYAMGPFNTRVVRRSNALQGWAYGRTFRYREVQDFGGSPVAPVLATAVAGGMLAVGAGLALPLTRPLVDRLLPSPGDGPSERTRRNGHFTVRVTASTTGGARYRSSVSATLDPGYGATAVMLAQSALALALDDLPPAAGVLTPVTGIGAGLADRLRTAGFGLRTERL